MTTADNLNGAQFMPVSDLIHMHSADALARHPDDDSMESILPDKNAEVDAMPPQPRQSMENAIKGGTIDPIEVNPEGGANWIANGHKRVARAHAMGVRVLPVHVHQADEDPLAGWSDL